MPDAATEMLSSIDHVRREWPGAGFVVGGRGLAPRVQAQSGLRICPRVSEVVEAVDAIVKRASFN